MAKNGKHAGGAMLLTALVGSIGTASAQESVRSSGGVEEIIVTAQKRAENVQDVPTAISVFTGDDLVARGVSDTTALQLVTPGLLFTYTNGFAQPFIRGVGSDQVGPAVESPVGFHVDGVYYPSIATALQELSDVERVEVLKGPQGTLYGRNTTGGAINIITREPSSTPTASGSVSIGNRGNQLYKGYVSGGSDVLAASLAGVWSKHDGYMTNLYNGKKLNDEDIWGFRAKLRFAPNDTFSMTLSGDITRRKDQSGTAYTPVGNPPAAVLLGGRVGQGPREAYHDFNKLGRNYKDQGIALTVRGDMGFAELVSISSYRDTSIYSGVDIDGSDLFLVGVSGIQKIESTSQEFQLISQNNDKFEWILGAYYFGSSAGFDPNRVDRPAGSSATRSKITTDAYALYGQASYNITDQLKITGGLRYNIERKTRNYIDTLLPTFSTSPRASKKWTNLSPKIAIQYDLGSNMFYASATRGFKSGVYNTGSAALPVVNPEKVDAFELGGKHDLLDRRLRINWAGYYYKYKDLQVLIVDPSQLGGLSFVQNAARAENYGVDLDAVAAVTDQLQITLGAAWLHSTYTSFPQSSVLIPNPTNGGFGSISVQRDVSGNRTIRSPKWTFNADVQYKIPIGDNELKLTGTYYYNDGFYFDTLNTIKQKAYSQVNLRADFSIQDDKFTVSAWMENVFDKAILSGVVPTALINLAQYTAPRTYGVALGFKF